MERFDRARYQALLKIDEDDLDRCLVEQPGLFFHVSEEVTDADSRQRLLTLELKELKAEIENEVRDTAKKLQDKLREDDIKNQVTLDPDVQRLERELEAATTRAEKAQKLEDAYLQRSYALKEKVAIELHRMAQLGVERGASSARYREAERIEKRLGEQRAEERRSRIR